MFQSDVQKRLYCKQQKQSHHQSYLYLAYNKTTIETKYFSRLHFFFFLGGGVGWGWYLPCVYGSVLCFFALSAICHMRCV